MPAKNPAPRSSGIDRRRWITSAATLAAGAATAPLLSHRVGAAEQTSPSAKPMSARTIVAPTSGNIVETAFHWQTPVLGGRPRAFHCAELPFVFANTDRCAAMTGGGSDARARRTDGRRLGGIRS